MFEIILIALVVFGAVTLYNRSRAQKQQLLTQRSALDGVRSAAEEDVTKLGEEVAALDSITAGTDLNEATRQDYQQALDSYDVAKSALARVAKPEDVRQVTEALEDGRYAIACVKARQAGDPLPTRRPPCFFNPQHGPSTDDVEWAPAGGIKRNVPACAADAERVRAGAEPITRKVLTADGSRRPYWEAGPAYGPWAGGYFGGYANSGLLPAILIGSMIGGGGFGNWDGSYSDGYADGSNDSGDSGDSDDGGDSGDGGGYDGGDAGGDAGGYDGGGGDWGGDFGGGGFGDFGGGDFGGGDF